MSQTLKVLAALIFVAVLGWVLLQPVFDAVEIDSVESDTEQTATPLGSRESSPAEEPSPEPSESEEEVATLPDEFRTRPLFDSYPQRCLRPGAGTQDLVLVETGDGVVAGPLRGPLEDVGGREIFGLSASEGWAAWEDGDRTAFVARPGIHDTISPVRRARTVVWSPISPCGLAVTIDGRLSVVLEDATLVQDEVRTVAFSPDGRKLAVVTAEDQATSLWVASLTDDRFREVYRDPRKGSVRIEAWDPGGRGVYLGLGDQQGLTFVTVSRPTSQARVSVDPIEQLTTCADRLLGIMNGAIVEVTNRGPDHLTDSEGDTRYISCSPAGNFVAAIGDEGLVLLDGNGSFLRDLTQDTGYTDVFVDWGAPGRGLLFGRVRSEGSPVAAELWYISEGGSPISTGVTYRGGPHAVDWSGSPPTGLP